MISSDVHTADDDGVIQYAGGPGYGILVMPGGAQGVAPGGLPIDLLFRGPAAPKRTVRYLVPQVLELPEPYSSVRLEGCTPGGAYTVHVLERPGVRVQPPSGRVAVSWTAQAYAELGTAAPTDDDSSGIALHPHWKSLLIYLSGTANDVDVYEQTRSGRWRKTDTLAAADWGDPTVLGPGIDMAVGVGGGRLALVAAGAGTYAEIEAQAEVG